jgi:hypothetical protein
LPEATAAQVPSTTGDFSDRTFASKRQTVGQYPERLIAGPAGARPGSRAGRG